MAVWSGIALVALATSYCLMTAIHLRLSISHAKTVHQHCESSSRAEIRLDRNYVDCDGPVDGQNGSIRSQSRLAAAKIVFGIEPRERASK